MNVLLPYYCTIHMNCAAITNADFICIKTCWNGTSSGMALAGMGRKRDSESIPIRAGKPRFLEKFVRFFAWEDRTQNYDPEVHEDHHIHHFACHVILLPGSDYSIIL